jgi:hypothetical protein
MAMPSGLRRAGQVRLPAGTGPLVTSRTGVMINRAWPGAQVCGDDGVAATGEEI